MNTIPAYYSAGQAFGQHSLTLSSLSLINTHSTRAHTRSLCCHRFVVLLSLVLFRFILHSGDGLMLAFHARIVMVADHFNPKAVLEALDQYVSFPLTHSHSISSHSPSFNFISLTLIQFHFIHSHPYSQRTCMFRLFCVFDEDTCALLLWHSLTSLKNC
jgi:hypothetical protein